MNNTTRPKSAETLINTYRDIMRKFVKEGMGLDEVVKQPEIIEVMQTIKSFDYDFFRQVYEKEFIYLWAFQGDLNIDSLMEKLKALPDDVNEKTTYELLGEKKTPEGRYELSPELKQLERLVYEKHLSIYYILMGGGSWNAYGATSKIRLLTVLEGLRTYWINKQVVTEPWGKYEKYENARGYYE